MGKRRPLFYFSGQSEFEKAVLGHKTIKSKNAFTFVIVGVWIVTVRGQNILRDRYFCDSPMVTAPEKSQRCLTFFFARGCDKPIKERH